MTKYTAGRGLGIMLLVAGVAHFVAPAGFDKIIPPALPFEPRFWTYLSGAAELTIGAMMFAPMTNTLFGKPIRQLGVWAAFALFVLVEREFVDDVRGAGFVVGRPFCVLLFNRESCCKFRAFGMFLKPA